MSVVEQPLAVMGGAFDPVHLGHLRTAIEMRQRTGFSELRLVPTGQPAHRAPPVASAAVRLRMLAAAVQDLPWCAVDEQELSRSGPSYTFDTLRNLRDRWPQRPVCLILGLDAFLGLASWHRWTELTDLAHLLVASRPGWTPELPAELQRWLQPRLVADAQALHSAPAGRVFIQAVTALDIASSAIRAQLLAGQDPRFLLPDAVLQIAIASGCYSHRAYGSDGSGQESTAV